MTSWSLYDNWNVNERANTVSYKNTCIPTKFKNVLSQDNSTFLDYGHVKVT